MYIQQQGGLHYMDYEAGRPPPLPEETITELS